MIHEEERERDHMMSNYEFLLHVRLHSMLFIPGLPGGSDGEHLPAMLETRV